MPSADRKGFNPTSRAFDERENTRTQSDWTYGMYNDGTPTEVANRGYYDLINMHNFGNRLRSRHGTMEWGDQRTQTRAARIPTEGRTSLADVEYQISDGVPRLVWDFVDTEFTTEDIGHFVQFTYNGTVIRAEITQEDEVNPKRCITEAVITESLTDVETDIAAPVNGWYVSKHLDVLVIHVGERIYIADSVFATEWTEVPFYGLPSNTIQSFQSTFAEQGNYIIVANVNGIYKIQAGREERYYIKCNTSNPPVPIGSVNESDNDPQQPINETTYPYGRKRVYSYTRFYNGWNIDRKSDDAQFEWESGGVDVRGDFEFDYGVDWTQDEISPDNPNTYGKVGITSDSIHATHYSTYCTLNISEEALKKGNNTEFLIWEADTPIMAVYPITLVDDGTFTVDSEGIAISQERLLTTGISTLGEAITIDTLSADGLSGTYSTHSLVNSSCGVAFGSSVVDQFLLSDTDLISSTTPVFAADDVGKPIFWFDGSVSYIREYITTSTVRINNVVVPEGFNYGAFNAIPVDITSVVTDAELLIRGRVFGMENRFWAPMENAQLCVYSKNFFATAKVNGTKVEYGQVRPGKERYLGQHNPEFQFHEVQDAIVALSDFDSSYSIKCKGSTLSLPVLQFITSGEEIGRALWIIQNVYTESANIGTVGVGSYCKINGSNNEMVITSEPALREFNGKEFSENVAEGRIMHKLNALNSNFCMAHHPSRGTIFWGREDY